MNELTAVHTQVDDLTPEQLGGEIRLLTAQARRMALSYGIQIGYRLRVAHDKVGPHGWAEWLKRETDFSAAAASRFEALYEGYGAEQGGIFGVENKFPTLENISISNALRLLAVPEEEREEVAAQVDAEHISARELERALAERDEARKALQEAERAIRESPLQAENEELRRKLHDAVETADQLTADAERLSDERIELLGKLKAAESRPVEVAVERDEEAIKKAADAARIAAEEKAAGDLDKLRKKLEVAEKAREKAEAQAKRADEGVGPYKEQAEQAREKAEAQAKRADEGVGPYKEQAEQARAEAEALRKKLVSAESGANVVGALFSLAQQNFNSALEKVVAMKATHPDVAEKLLAGMEQILGGLVEKVKGARG